MPDVPTHIQVVFDCHDPDRLARFWAEALHYSLQPPPPGYESWPAFLRAQGIPESRWNSASAVIDPEGKGPRIFFQQVPEGKAVKNRVHLDLNVGGGREIALEERKRRIAGEAERLITLGAQKGREVDEPLGYCVNMLDPELNEFDLQ
jgi:hypothetical protein